VVGGDGGGLDDLYGLCVAGREKGTDRWLFWFRAWCWPEVLMRRKQIAPMLRDFAAAGDLVICEERSPVGDAGTPPSGQPGDPASAIAAYELPQDIREIVAICVQVKKSGRMPENSAIGLDAAMATDLADALEAAGFTVADGTKGEVVAIGQGFRLMSAIVGLARKLKFGGALHSGSPMMAWCVSNAKEEQGRQSVMINKYASGSAKIDPFMAGLNAVKLLENNPEAVSDNGGLSAWADSLRAVPA
jgi:phage terminase large subunit-like protein